jgi:hypothetical protein
MPCSFVVYAAAPTGAVFSFVSDTFLFQSRLLKHSDKLIILVIRIANIVVLI